MASCIKLLKKQQIVYKIHEYTCDSSINFYGEEAVLKLGFIHEQVFKTLVVVSDTK